VVSHVASWVVCPARRFTWTRDHGFTTLVYDILATGPDVKRPAIPSLRPIPPPPVCPSPGPCRSHRREAQTPRWRRRGKKGTSRQQPPARRSHVQYHDIASVAPLDAGFAQFAPRAGRRRSAPRLPDFHQADPALAREPSGRRSLPCTFDCPRARGAWPAPAPYSPHPS